VRPERDCQSIRTELSARLDGEVDARASAWLDDHLETCAECRTYEAELRNVRRALRLAPAEDVPDLTGRIVHAVREERRSGLRRAEWRARVRTAAIAAAATAALLVGAGAPWLERPTDTAEADEIVSEIRAAARSLTTYRATYRIVERGWDQRIDERRMLARVWFKAPESFRIEIDDRTAYPSSAWPSNDVSIVARPDRYWISEPVSCPVEALPSCSGSGERRESTALRRAPFDGSTRFPTDVAVPLETVAASRGFEIEGVGTVAGRRAVRLELSYRDAVPLVASLEGGGSWRPFHPLDRVDLWIDASTWFPLRYRIISGDSAERVEWARANGVTEGPGEVVLDVTAASFREPGNVAAGVFRVPASGVVTSDDFRPGGIDLLGPQAPRYRAGLQPYRAGRSSGATVLTYARGLTWLKVTISGPSRGHAAGADPAVTDEVELGSGSYGYYRPAGSSSSRSVDVYGTTRTYHLESNLARDQLLQVASSLRFDGRKIDPGGSAERVATGSLPEFALVPRWLPEGYDPEGADAVLVRNTCLLYFRSAEAEYDGLGIRVTQTRAARLPPTSETIVGVGVGGEPARWSVERGELEWVDGGVYRAVSAPSFDLATALEIARSMR
jgi:hypothetical protein